MGIKNPVYVTALFKNVAPYIQSVNPMLLAYEMARASEVTKIKWDAESIDGMCVWVETPQGMDYWQKLEDEFKRNKRAKRIVSIIDDGALI